MSTSKEQAFWALVKSDPMAFLQVAFNTIYPGKELTLNWHIDAIVFQLEQCLEGKLTRLIINLPPRHLKSFITSVAWPAFLLAIDPTAKIICISYSDDLAKKLAADFRRLIESDWYRKVFPHVVFAKTTESEVVTDQGGGRYATSVGGTLTGRGADFIIVDDPLKPEDALSESARNKVNDWYQSTLLSRLDDKKRSVLIIVMQRLHVNDLVGYVENEGDWLKLSFPAIAKRTEFIALRNEGTHRRFEGDALQEEYESLETLKWIRARVGAFNFASQYQQSPMLLDSGLFKRRYFQLIDRLPVSVRQPEGQLLVSIDTASSTSESADYTALTVAFAYGSMFYILYAKRGRWDYEKLLAIALDYLERLGPQTFFLVEAAASGISLIRSLEKRGVHVFHYRPKFDKMARAAFALPILADGRVFVVNEPDRNGWVEEYIGEFTSFPHGRHDDWVDSLTQLLPWADQRLNPQSRVYFLGGIESVSAAQRCCRRARCDLRNYDQPPPKARAVPARRPSRDGWLVSRRPARRAQGVVVGSKDLAHPNHSIMLTQRPRSMYRNQRRIVIWWRTLLAGDFMAEGRPALVSDFSMQAPAVVLDRVSYSTAASYPFREDYLQWLLDTTPDLLPVRDFFPTAMSLISLGREIPVDLGNRQGYIDNLFVTNDARLVLVETKLYRNPEGIREVVAQTYQYGAAISAMTFIEFEEALRKGMKGGAELKPGETIAARIRGLQMTSEYIGVVDDFEDRLATNIQRGEVLYLIVADGIHASVERMTSWLNEYGGSAPHRFGLVELRSYMTGAGAAIVVPRTLVRTKEISRHVVVIESRATEPVTATVEDRTGTSAGAVTITSRVVKTSGPGLTKNRLLEDLCGRSPSDADTATELIAALEAAAFDTRSTTTELQYGFTFPPGEGELFPMLSLTTSGVWSYLRAKVIAAVGEAGLRAFKERLSQVAPFFHANEIHDPKKQFGHPVKYAALAAGVEPLVGSLVESRTVALEAMMQRGQIL